MKLAVHFLSAAIVVAAASVPAAYVFENFDGGSGNPPGSSGWTMPADVYITNAPAPAFAGGSLYIPVQKTLSNQAICGTGTKVWTDFYTIPRPFSSDTETAPAIDTNATALFFVNTNGIWETISGNGSGGYLTQTWSQVLGVEGTYPTAVQNNVFYHISVLHDYTVTPARWSLFVNDLALATNLYAISTNVSQHEWFQMQNFGGSETNICYLDEFLVTNKVPATIGSTNTVPGTDIPQSFALAHFDTLQNPMPVGSNIAISGTTVTLTCSNVAAGGNYVILGGATTNGMAVLNGVAFDSNGQLARNDLNTSAKYFYRIVRQSEIDPSVAITNSETYACYRQDRVQSHAYVVGAPVDTLDGDRTVGGTLGRQLATGLSANDTMTIYTNGGGTMHAVTFTRQGNGTWAGANTSLTIAPGQGVLIKRLPGGDPTSSTVLAGTVPTNTVVAVPIVAGWNIVSWPYESTGTLGELTGLTAETSTVGDYIFLQNLTSDITLARYTTGGWKTGVRLGGGAVINPILQPGAGIFIYHTGADGSWSP